MDTIVRDKLRVFEAMYNVISESSEWAYNSGNDYMYFIEGVVAMTREQIKEIDERPAGEPEPDSYTPDKSELGRCIPVNIEGLTVSTSRDNVGMYNTYMNGKLD